MPTPPARMSVMSQRLLARFLRTFKDMSVVGCRWPVAARCSLVIGRLGGGGYLGWLSDLGSALGSAGRVRLALDQSLRRVSRSEARMVILDSGLMEPR